MHSISCKTTEIIALNNLVVQCFYVKYLDDFPFKLSRPVIWLLTLHVAPHLGISDGNNSLNDAVICSINADS